MFHVHVVQSNNFYDQSYHTRLFKKIKMKKVICIKEDWRLDVWAEFSNGRAPSIREIVTVVEVSPCGRGYHLSEYPLTIETLWWGTNHFADLEPLDVDALIESILEPIKLPELAPVSHYNCRCMIR